MYAKESGQGMAFETEPAGATQPADRRQGTTCASSSEPERSRQSVYSNTLTICDAVDGLRDVYRETGLLFRTYPIR